MATQKIAFTAERLKTAIAAAGSGPTAIHDSATPGLQVRIQPGAAAAFVVRFRTAGAGLSSSKRITIAKVGEITVAEARQKALEIIKSARAGDDPLSLRKEAARSAEAARRSAITLSSFLDEYSRHQKREGIASSPQKVAAVKRHCEKLLREPLAALTRRVLIERLDIIATRLPAAAGTVRSTLHNVFEIAIDRGVLETNPLAHRRRRGSLKNKNLKAAAETALSIEDLARIWVAAGDKSVNPAFGLYVKTLIATGARRTELSLATTNNITAATNEFPAQLLLKAPTTKTGVDHVVFLPPLIMREIEGLPRRADTRLLFPGRRRMNKTPPMSGWTKLLAPLVVAAKSLGVTDHVHLHGLRRGFRTGLSAIGVDRDVAERMVAHQVGGALEKIYDKHSFQKERADASRKWCDALAAEIAKIKYAPTDARAEPLRRSA